MVTFADVVFGVPRLRRGEPKVVPGVALSPELREIRGLGTICELR
jgi:hypothetical protein